MRTIPLADGKFKTAEIIKAVASMPATGQGINVEEMRRRIRIIDALEGASDDALEIEDADHQFLVSLMAAFPFAVADRELLSVIESIEKAT